jgi:hypothetical protein
MARNRRTRRAMRDVLRLHDVLHDIAAGSSKQAAAARRLLCWALQQPAAATATADDGIDDDAVDADDADDDDGDGDGELQQQSQQQQQQQHHQQQLQHGSLQLAASGSGSASQLQLLQLGDRDQAAFRRRSGGFHKQRCGAGNAAGTREALCRWNTLSMVCSRPGCGAIVDHKVARRQAKQAGRVHFEHGDGCAGPAPCSDDHRAARFAKRQRAYAEQLETGERLLIRWPADREDRDIWYYPDEAAASAASAARAAFVHAA